MDKDLESLYQEAKSALKAKEYDRASDLLRQILLIDENYKDASRLLAQAVRLKRRRWYNDPRLWGAAGVIAFIALGTFLAPRVQRFYAGSVASSTSGPAVATLPTSASIPISTPIPLTWKRIYVGQEFPRDLVTAIVIDTQDPDLMYADTQHAGIYKSIDGGVSWSPVQLDEFSNNPSYQVLLNSSRDTQDNVNTFYNTAPDGIRRSYRNSDFWYISEDGGTTWRRFSEGGTYHQFNPIAFDKLGAVYVFCGGNICKFSADVKQLSILGDPEVGVETTIVISPQNPNTIYAAGEGLAISRDGGYTWVDLNNGLGGIKLFLEAGTANSNSLYLLLGECNRGRERSTMEQPIYRSVDGGFTWEFLDKRGCFIIVDADGQNAYRLATDTDNYEPWIWHLSANGQRWGKVRIPSAITTLVADPSRSGMLYAYDGQGQDPKNKYISKDYGYSWSLDSSVDVKPCYGSTVHFLDTYKPIAIDPLDGNHVFFINNGGLLESYNSCGTTEALATTPSTSMTSIVFDPHKPNTLYAGTDGGAYISSDSGKSWNQINDGLLGAKVVYSIVVDKDSNVYAATPYEIFKLEGK